MRQSAKVKYKNDSYPRRRAHASMKTMLDPSPTLVVYHNFIGLSRKNLCGVARTFAGLAADLVEF